MSLYKPVRRLHSAPRIASSVIKMHRSLTSHLRYFWSIFFFTLLMVLGLAGTKAFAALYWTKWVSEENGGPPAYCLGWNEAAVGFACSKSYCDNVALLCETLPFGMTMNGETYSWTDFFSEEHDNLGTYVADGWYGSDGMNSHVCFWLGHRPGLLTGIKCKGSYCDNISLECAQPIKWKNGIKYYVEMENVEKCEWSGWYSEEQGKVDFGWNRYITGVQCRGRYCDNKSFYVCSLIDPAP